MEFIAFTQRQEAVEFLSTVHCKNSPLAVSSPEFLARHPNRGEYPGSGQVQVRIFLRQAYRMPSARTATKMPISATVTRP